MTINVMINGFGRIGRLTLRALVEEKKENINIVAINHPRGVESAVYLYKYDSVHGIAHGDVTHGEDWIDVGFGKIKILSDRDPKNLDLNNIDLVMECSGKFKKREDINAFIDAGAKKILVSAPFDEADKTVVFGVNDNVITPDDTIVSNASCTTNCLAPVAYVLEKEFGIENGFMTTIHAYTGDQNILDGSHNDKRRSRAGAVSIVPTKTGAAKAISKVMPQLDGKMDGVAIRVPTPNVSCVDLKVDLKKIVSKDDVNNAMKNASETYLKGILGYETDELVSVDFNHNPNSSIFDATQTMAISDKSIRILSWYDNEWGFSVRMLDTAVKMFDK